MEINPTAQGTPAGENGNSVNEGFQKRIDEVIAQVHNYKRENDSLRETLASTQAAVAASLNRSAAPVQEVAAPEMDPADMEKINYFVEKAQAPMRAQLQQLIGLVSQTRVEPQIAAVQSRLAQINNPQIEKRVNELISIWKNDGRLANGSATPGDALKIAAGEFSLGQLVEQAQSGQERKQYNAGFTPVSGAGGRASVQNITKPSTRNIEDMSVEELQAQIRAGEQANPDGHDL